MPIWVNRTMHAPAAAMRPPDSRPRAIRLDTPRRTSRPEYQPTARVSATAAPYGRVTRRLAVPDR
nr:hypothetical protein [Actinomadura sp. J1-007]